MQGDEEPYITVHHNKKLKFRKSTHHQTLPRNIHRKQVVMEDISKGIGVLCSTQQRALIELF
jgi:hypothetical protein